MQPNNTPANPPSRRKQAKKPKGFTLWAKNALLVQGLTVTDLARAIGKTRGSVSLAINHPSVLPSVVTLIKTTLSQKEDRQ